METFGRYTLVRRVGSGGMAEVWKARASGPAGFEKSFALKLVLPELAMRTELLEMLVDEAKLVAQLTHPNIVQVTDFGRADKSRWFIAMEYVEGQNLHKLLERARMAGVKLPLEVALHVTAECLKALAFAHGKKVVHRDVSPHNVLIGYGGEIKLGDFGIAKVASAASRTQAGAIRGKAAYMSPEQVRGETLDGRSDLFSLGLVLCEIVTGQRLFEGNSLDILERIAAFTLADAPLASLPASIRDVAARALDPDREKRFRHAGKMEEAIVSLLGTGVLEARKALAALMDRLFEHERRFDSAPGNEETNISAAGPIPDYSPAPGTAITITSSLDRGGVIPGGDATSRPSSTILLPPTESSVHRRKPSGAGSTLAIAAALLAVVGALTVEWAPRGQRAVPTPTAEPFAISAETPDATPEPSPARTISATVTPTPRPRPTRIVRATPIATVVAVVKSGLLRVNARPSVEVWVDGKRVAEKTPTAVHLIAGPHKIRFVAGAFQAERSLTIEDGQELSVWVDVASGRIIPR